MYKMHSDSLYGHHLYERTHSLSLFLWTLSLRTPNFIILCIVVCIARIHGVERGVVGGVMVSGVLLFQRIVSGSGVGAGGFEACSVAVWIAAVLILCKPLREGDIHICARILWQAMFSVVVVVCRRGSGEGIGDRDE